MELMIRRPGKGLDLLPLFRGTTVASLRIEEICSKHRFVAGHSSYIIHSVGDISYETGCSIRFFQASDCTDSTRSPLGPRKIFINNFNGMS